MPRKDHWQGRVLVSNRHCPAAPLSDFLRDAWDLTPAGVGLLALAPGTPVPLLPQSLAFLRQAGGRD